MADRISLDELASRTGEAVEPLRHWQRLGLLGDDAARGFAPRDVERVRLIAFAERRGFAAEEVARISAAQGDIFAWFIDQLGTSGRLNTHTFDETAEALGFEPEVLERLWVAAGMRDQPYAYEEDVEALRWVAGALTAGIPEEAVLQIVRVFADASSRVAEAVFMLFHEYVHERFRAEGLSGAELVAATQAIGDPLVGLIEPAVLYFHHKGWERALREDMLLHLAEETSTPAPVPGQVMRTVLFVDLSSFTPLTEAMGDAAAAQVLERFSGLVRQAAAEHKGQVVKQIGDAFMVVFSDARSAVSFGLAVEDQVSAEPAFPAVRMGAHAGPVLYREGDYLGVNVNIAARVAAKAERHELLVTDAGRAQAAGLAELDFVSLGASRLKGITEEVELFEVRPVGERRLRAIDPVCGMELDPHASDVRLSWHGRDLRFCSAECLERFAQAPDRYTVAQGSSS